MKAHKWMPALSEYTATMFVSSLLGYRKPCAHSRAELALAVDIRLFERAVLAGNNGVAIVFLSDCELFEHSLREHPMELASAQLPAPLPSDKNGSDVEHCTEFVSELFRGRVHGLGWSVHVVCAELV